MKHILLAYLLIGLYLFISVNSSRILGVFPVAIKSHHILGSALMRGLADAGHDVTMISPYEVKKTPPTSRGTYRDILLTGISEKILQGKNLFKVMHGNTFGMLIQLQLMFESLTDSFFNHSNVKKLLASNERFDVVIVHQLYNDAMKILAHRFDAPLICFVTVGASSMINSMVAHPSQVSYVPFIMSDLPRKMNFLQRTHNLFLYVFDELIRKYRGLPYHDSILKKYFPNSPSVYDLHYNASLMLLNSHESLGDPVPLVPNMIQIGGFHVQKPKPLPKDLREFLDKANEGVIYFSMGSNFLSKDMPLIKRNVFLKAFGKLKQKVLWKWEEDELPGQPSNVKLGKWLPQQDILAHPNVKLFISHGGRLSTIETIYHGVPVLLIPMLGDQLINAKITVSNGYALSLPFHDPEFSEERLSALIQELLHNSTYTNNAQQRSRIFHDRPLTPMENAVYWVEYVIRNRGAPHLRVAGVDLPWYQYLLLDVFFLIFVAAALVTSVLCLGFRKLFRKESRQKIKKN